MSPSPPLYTPTTSWQALQCLAFLALPCGCTQRPTHACPHLSLQPSCPPHASASPSCSRLSRWTAAPRWQQPTAPAAQTQWQVDGARCALLAPAMHSPRAKLMWSNASMRLHKASHMPGLTLGQLVHTLCVQRVFHMLCMQRVFHTLCVQSFLTHCACKGSFTRCACRGFSTLCACKGFSHTVWAKGFSHCAC